MIFNGIPVILAHGALGGLDEGIFIAIAVIFFGMMGFSWWRSRNFEPEMEGLETENAETTPDGSAAEFQPEAQANPERFTLK